MKKTFYITLLLVLSLNIFPQEIHSTQIAVLDLKSLGVEDHFSLILSERLRSELFKYEKFKVMSRESMKDIMDEQAFQMSGTCDENSCYIKLGAILSVEKIVTGSIGKLGNTYSLTVKIISVETGEIEDTFTDSKKCAEDDLFTMIENAAKLLTKGNNTKISSPEDVKEIKEIQPQRSTTADGFTSANDDIKEWETHGLSREEYIEYKKSKLTIKEFENFKKSGLTYEQYKNRTDEYYEQHKMSLFGNSVKSLIIPGWGQYKVGSYKKAYWHWAIEGIIALPLCYYMYMDNVYYDDNYIYYYDEQIILGNLLWIFNLYSSVDALYETNKFNKILKQNYRLSISPNFNPLNNEFGLGFSFNF